MGKVGSKIKINLINEHGIHEALSNEFKNEIEFKVAIYNCTNNTENTDEILEIVNKYSKFRYKWTVYYQDECLLIFKNVDGWGNKNYLHVEFN